MKEPGREQPPGSCGLKDRFSVRKIMEG